MVSFCHSKKAGSPLDIAKKKGQTEIVSMMTESLECEFKENGCLNLSISSFIPCLFCCTYVCLFIYVCLGKFCPLLKLN